VLLTSYVRVIVFLLSVVSNCMPGWLRAEVRQTRALPRVSWFGSPHLGLGDDRRR
jgi:hypothetical protein